MPARPSIPLRKTLGRRWPLCLICLSLLMARSLLAQDSGQICILTYDDRNGDGARGADERAIARGIGASLMTAGSLIIDSALLDDSPFAASGLLCFDDLLAGDYRIQLTSAEFAGTTAAAFEASVKPGEAPARVEFGVRSLLAETSTSASVGRFAVDEAAVTALIKGLLGGAVTFVIMSVIGLLIYLLVFQPRLARASPPAGPAPMRPPAIGDGAPAPAPRQSAIAPFRHVPGAGSPPVFADDQTDAPGTNGLLSRPRDN